MLLRALNMYNNLAPAIRDPIRRSARGAPRARGAVKLAERADVILQNFRPGVVERMGIGYEACSANNRGLVYMSISGFGKVGPYAQKRVYDPVIQAVSWLPAIQADADGRPSMMRLIVPDKVTALTSAQAISTALVRKYRTGQGAHIHLSMLDARLDSGKALDKTLSPGNMTVHGTGQRCSQDSGRTLF
eukprot:SAG31_NODE_3368_length_4355_cov_29.144267_2_plen_189_part_00